MGNKEDWEELEKWQKEHEEKMVNKYGTDFKEPKFHKPRKISIAISKFMDNFFWGVCYFLIGMLVFIIFVATALTFISWRTTTNVNVVGDLSARYGKDIENKDTKEK